MSVLNSQPNLHLKLSFKWLIIFSMVSEYYNNSKINIYIPEKFRIYIQERPFKEFTGQMLTQYDRVYRHLYRGGVVLVNGNWEKIKLLYRYIVRKQNDISRGKRSKSNLRFDSDQVNHLLYRFALFAQKDTILTEPPQYIPYLFNFVGEIEVESKKDECYYIPLYEFMKIKESLKKQYNVNALNERLISHYTVLPPASQKIYTLFRSVLETLQPSIPHELSVLDMGCGSGVLTFITVFVLKDRLKTIHVTDILPEALGSCKYNIDQLNEKNTINTKKISVLNSGDLFTPVDRKNKYDCILFNPPWTVKSKWSKENKATSDYEFRVLNSFLRDAATFLSTHGIILLFYSDHSGKDVMDTVEKLIKKYSYIIKSRFQEKIRAKRKSKKWEKCFIIILNKNI